MRTCFVTAFPPNKRGRNEHGYHAARELLRQDPLLAFILAFRLLPFTTNDRGARWM